MMEKRGVIDIGLTPPETEQEKQASVEQLDGGVVKRMSESVKSLKETNQEYERDGK